MILEVAVKILNDGNKEKPKEKISEIIKELIYGFIVLTILIFIIVIRTAIMKYDTVPKDYIDVFLLVVILSLAVFYIIHYFSVLKREEQLKQEEFKNELNYYLSLGKDEYDPLGHLKLNWLQVKGYYEISKRQATMAFGWTIFIGILGFLLIVFSVISPLIPQYPSEGSNIPIIGAIGGVVVEFFAGTILLVYNKTLTQMNLYHQALSKYQRYLSCVNLVGRFSNPEKQDAMYEEIIRIEMSNIQEKPVPDKQKAEKIEAVPDTKPVTAKKETDTE